jgi:hypothetical protein
MPAMSLTCRRSLISTSEGAGVDGVTILIGFLWLVLALITGRKAADRGMSQWGGILFGLILGPLGLAIVLLMPDRT